MKGVLHPIAVPLIPQPLGAFEGGGKEAVVEVAFIPAQVFSRTWLVIELFATIKVGVFTREGVTATEGGFAEVAGHAGWTSGEYHPKPSRNSPGYQDCVRSRPWRPRRSGWVLSGESGRWRF